MAGSNVVVGIDLHRSSGAVAIHHKSHAVHAAGVIRSAHNEVSQAVAVDISCAIHRRAQVIHVATQHVVAQVRSELGVGRHGNGLVACLAVNDVHLTARIGIRSHQQITQTITVDITCVAHLVTEVSLVCFDLVAQASSKSIAEVKTVAVDRAGIVFAENHKCRFASEVAAIFVGHHQIGQSVAIGIARAVDGITKIVVRTSRQHFETRTGSNGATAQVGHCAVGIAIHHKSRTGTVLRPRGSDDEIVVPIAIEVTNGGHVTTKVRESQAVGWRHNNGTAGICCGEVQGSCIADARVGVARQIFHRRGRDLDVVACAGQ